MIYLKIIKLELTSMRHPSDECNHLAELQHKWIEVEPLNIISRIQILDTQTLRSLKTICEPWIIILLQIQIKFRRWHLQNWKKIKSKEFPILMLDASLIRSKVSFKQKNRYYVKQTHFTTWQAILTFKRVTKEDVEILVTVWPKPFLWYNHKKLYR
jgi:uncharacterized membrane protein YwaF